ncbi:hypothetical protein [Rickettsiella massiliensis]|uniref:hypothetical protein n=1 Tax=Rickettsiella massiliensis TaxID=676517 RepID=UPI00029A4395|nr:hypothetical protein [Rickettsiella massiliensis]
MTHLKKSVTPDSTTSLPILLNKIINQRFAFPKNAQDKTAFIALYLLCLGTETYISILHFLLDRYGYLANNHY